MMHITSVSLLARLFLFAVLGVAGGAKLIDRQGSRQALLDFGVPVRFAAVFGVLLPVAELIVAAALLAPSYLAWRGAIAATALLTLFTAALVFNLTRGRTPNCRCFGNFQSTPIGWPTVVRNAVFVFLAAFIVSAGQDRLGASPLHWIRELTLTERLSVLGVAAGLAVATAEAALLFQMLRQQGRVFLRLEAIESSVAIRKPGGEAETSVPAAEVPGLAVGSRAPDFLVQDTEGRMLTLQSIFAEKVPALMLFTNPSCGPCQSLMPEVVRWQQEQAWRLKVVLISEGKPEDNRAKVVGRGARNVFLQKKREVAEAYQAWGTPSAVLLNLDGTIGSGVLQGGDAIREFVTRMISRSPRLSEPRLAAAGSGVPHRDTGNWLTPVLHAGDTVPPLKLRDMEGNAVSLAGSTERETLLVFWNPSCGFCQKMRSDLTAWELDRPPEAPGLLVISSGTLEENRGMNLLSPVVLEQSSETARLFGASGTPMAVLVDRSGRVKSSVVAGSRAIFALARSADEVQSEVAREQRGPLPLPRNSGRSFRDAGKPDLLIR